MHGIFFVVKRIQTIGIENLPDATNATIYPNLANENMEGVCLYDQKGRPVTKIAYQIPLQETNISTREKANRLYFL